MTVTKAEWDRIVRLAKRWLEDIQPIGITRKIEGKEYVLIDVVATQKLARSIASDGRSEGVSVRVVPLSTKNAHAIYVWHNHSPDALDWIKTAMET
jgi:hypothetical protein